MPISSSLSFGSTAAGTVTRLLSNIQSSIESTFIIKKRNAIVRKIFEIQGHRFATILLTKPTYCSRCHELIWGLHGFSCQLCKLASHQKCLATIRSTCVLSSSSQHNDEQHQHHFEEHVFNPLDPANCNHCGTLIYSLIKLHQGLQCSRCKVPVHYDCKKLVCSDCNPNSNVDGNRTSTQEDKKYTFDHQSKISIGDFEIIKLLGTGSFSKVYLSKFRDNPDREFAIKVIKKTNLVVSSDPGSVFTEVRTLHLGRQYPFLATVHCSFQSEDRLYLVMEHVVGRDLVYYLRKARKFTEDRARFYVAEIVLALIFLHNKSIIHRDLKLDNVILERDGHCKLIDFGMSKRLSDMENNKTRTFCGTPNYISPEIIRRFDYDYSVDWWSLGVLLYEMLIGYSPFEADDEEKIYRLIENEKVRYPAHLSDRARLLLEGLLTKDPRDRLGCQIMNDRHMAIRDHPFFIFPDVNSFQWIEIEAKQRPPPCRPSREDLMDANDGDELEDEVNLTPISQKQLERITHDDYDGFSFYSESFNELTNFG